MTSSEIQELFEQTLIGEYDDDAPWEAVSALMRNGNREIFETAASWLKNDSPLKRARAAAILGQVRTLDGGKELEKPRWLFRDETVPLLMDLLEHESNAIVLSSAISALGHLDNEAAIPTITKYKDHPDHNIRFSVTCSLGHFPNHPEAIASLIPLTSDEDANVRDWAVFGLGVQGDVDSAEIREALLERITDPDEDVREEAVVGLGKRQDLRLLPSLRAMLDDAELKLRVAEAADAMLGLPEYPEDWDAEDYKKALDEKFGSQ